MSLAATAVATVCQIACTSFGSDEPGDVGTVADASGETAEASAAEGGAAPRFCASVDAAALVLCDDFDDRADPAPWRPELGDPQASYAITQVAFVSSPSSLQATIAPGPDKSPDARYRFDLPRGSQQHVSVSGMIRVPTRELNVGGVHVAMVQIGGLGGASLNMTGDVAESVRFSDGGQDFRSAPGLGALPADWTPFSLVVDLTIPAVSVRVGDKALGQVRLDASKRGASDYTPTVYLGIWEGKPSSQVGFVAQFDDVVIRAY